MSNPFDFDPRKKGPPLGISAYSFLNEQPKPVRRKVFISYHHADEREVLVFLAHFNPSGATFIKRGLGAGMSEDIINSTNADYIMGRIRREYLGDSTVTIVLMGKCTWGRRYVDWEIQASLRQGEVYTPNGLIGIKLPSFGSGKYPERFNLNLRWPKDLDCFARVYGYPPNPETLRLWIEDAHASRTKRAHLIRNPREDFKNDRRCCVTHHPSLVTGIPSLMQLPKNAR